MGVESRPSSSPSPRLRNFCDAASLLGQGTAAVTPLSKHAGNMIAQAHGVGSSGPLVPVGVPVAVPVGLGFGVGSVGLGSPPPPPPPSPSLPKDS